MSESSQHQLLRRGVVLEYLTLIWNVVGVGVVAVAALQARSVSLAGFGLDSLVEIFASVVVIWHIQGSGRHREGLALRLIGAAFLLLALYIAAQTLAVLLLGGRAAPSSLGAVWLGLTVAAMLALAYGKAVIGQQLGNAVLLAESRVTVVDACLAGTVLIGLLLNTVLGWWWADPLAGAVIVVYAIREGLAHWREGITLPPSSPAP